MREQVLRDLYDSLDKKYPSDKYVRYRTKLRLAVRLGTQDQVEFFTRNGTGDNDYKQIQIADDDIFYAAFGRVGIHDVIKNNGVLYPSLTKAVFYNDPAYFGGDTQKLSVVWNQARLGLKTDTDVRFENAPVEQMGYIPETQSNNNVFSSTTDDYWYQFIPMPLLEGNVDNTFILNMIRGNTTTLAYTSDTDNDGEVDRVRYAILDLEGVVIKKGRKKNRK